MGTTRWRENTDVRRWKITFWAKYQKLNCSKSNLQVKAPQRKDKKKPDHIAKKTPGAVPKSSPQVKPKPKTGQEGAPTKVLPTPPAKPSPKTSKPTPPAPPTKPQDGAKTRDDSGRSQGKPEDVLSGSYDNNYENEDEIRAIAEEHNKG